MGVGPVTIREAAPEDASVMAALNQWVHTLHVEAEPAIYRPLDPAVAAERIAQELREGGIRAWLAFRGDEAVGMVRCEHVEREATAHAHPRRYVEVHELVVDPSVRRQRVGRALMEAAEGWAAELGVGVQLTCMGFNEAARRFYEELGYEVVSTRFRKG